MSDSSRHMRHQLRIYSVQIVSTLQNMKGGFELSSKKDRIDDDLPFLGNYDEEESTKQTSEGI